MDERYIDVSYDEDNGLRLVDALHAVFSNSLFCLAMGFVVAGVFLAYTVLRMKPQYESSFTLYVSNRPISEETLTEAMPDYYYLGVGDLQASSSLSKTYAFIFESREIALKAVKLANLSSYEERAQKQQLISTSTEQEMPLMTVTVTADSPEDAYKISGAVIDLIPECSSLIPGGSTVTVLEPSDMPTSPSSPKKKLNAAIGFLLGFGLSVLIVIILKDRNKFVGEKDELEDRFDTPAFIDVQNVMPLTPRSGSRAIGIMDAEDGSQAAADALALAESYAARGGRVLLIDGDNDGSACGRLLGVNWATGLSEILSGTRTASDVVHHLRGERLDFIASGKHADDFALKAGGAQMDSLLTDLKSEYDSVVIAIPSVLSDGNALALAGGTNKVFLSVRAGKTRKPDVAEALRRIKLADACIDGFIYSKPQEHARRLKIRRR